jgi:hypothetical protein
VILLSGCSFSKNNDSEKIDTKIIHTNDSKALIDPETL